MPDRHHTPEAKQAARMRARNALREGELVKASCFVCDSPQSEMHHPDYGKPLEIIWVCRRHHKLLFHSEWPGEKRLRKLEAAKLLSQQLAAKRAARARAPFWVDLREFDDETVMRPC